METITLGGGCFWCIEAIFKEIRGVISVVSGYAGGNDSIQPDYWRLHHEDTGHAEVIQVLFDPAIISLRELLEVFFAVHDPTTPNRQGNDVGPEYRSLILYNNEHQKDIANNVIQTFAQAHWESPVITEVKPLAVFTKAEEDQQDFFARNPEQAYCQLIINPKLTKFRQDFAEKLKN